MRYLIGVDEAGRAPLAGPVSVGAVIVPERFNVLAEFPGVRDSKKLSEKKREELYALLKKRQKQGDVQFVVRFSSHTYIDRYGITKAVRRAVWSGVRAFASEPGETHVLLDGLLKAPPQFSQETIIRGDDLVPLISLASIAAKVMRDHLMVRMDKLHPEYGFAVHKGYPTAMHRQAIKEYGLSVIHRRTFCKNVLNVAE